MITQYSDASNVRVWSCLSTDTKPLKADGVRQGDRLVEMNSDVDSTKTYIFDSNADSWVPSTSGADNGSVVELASLGQLGGKYIASGTTTTPDSGYSFLAIQVVEECEITLVGNISGITNQVFQAGTIIYGRFTSVTLGSGIVIAYNGV